MVSISPINVTEHNGHCYHYPVPSMVLDAYNAASKTAVILGAGPSGLVAALTLKDIGYENVIVLEKRDRFSRMNVINLHPESLHIFKRLDILNQFIARASLIVDHRNHVFYNDDEIYSFNDFSDEPDINPDHPFDTEDVLNGFHHETLYSISLADLQDLLAKIACERGVKMLSQVEAHLAPNAERGYSVNARVAHSPEPLLIPAPDLILVAEGGNSATFRELGGKYLQEESLWPNENWIFGHFQCNPEYGFCHLLFEFYENDQDLKISNCIFLPHKNEVNIAVTVKDATIASWRIREIIAEQAIKVLAASGVKATKREVSWHSNQAVRIEPKTAARSHFGRNVILIGDAAGSNSPVAAFGGTLSASAYSYALRELVKDLESLDADIALAHYSRRAQAYVTRWHNRVGEIAHKINHDIRQKTTKQVAAISRQKDHYHDMQGTV